LSPDPSHRGRGFARGGCWTEFKTPVGANLFARLCEGMALTNKNQPSAA
jgi:hypothetical protein